MPISTDEWEKGRTDETLESRVENFLRNNQGQAFTLGEIAHGLYKFDNRGIADILVGMGSIFIVKDLLNKLVEKGTVESKTIQKEFGTEEYYTVI